ncbi:endonuclease NucS [Candidatus Bathyarchaeota archaeon]|nr:endonuclease NucS [Candidatus Bathyarchaeota archaeon]
MPPQKTVVYASNPGLKEAYKLLRDGVSKHLTVVLIGDFKVEYEGRAASTLDFGERMLIIKRDGAVLVHRSEGYEPVNWQPGGGIINVLLDGDRLTVRAIRKTPPEVLKISLRKVYALLLLRLRDVSEFHLYVSEEEMHDAVLANPSLIEEGFKPLSFEKRVKPGFIDVYGVDSAGRLVVVEIKRSSAGREAVLQLARYISSLKSEAGREIRGILAAPSLRKGAREMLERLRLEYKYLDPKLCFETLKKRKSRRISDYFPESVKS